MQLNAFIPGLLDKGEMLMPSLESEVLQGFGAKLGESDELSPELVDVLSEMLGGAKLPKADQIVDAISRHSGENVA